MNIIRKGQIRWLGNEDVVGQVAVGFGKSSGKVHVRDHENRHDGTYRGGLTGAILRLASSVQWGNRNAAIERKTWSAKRT